MAEERRRYEKQDEKEEEKRQETQEKEEKSWDEKWRRDPLGAIIWALILIWAGFVFLADNMGFLAGLRDLGLRREVSGLAALAPWDLIFLGAGVIVLVEVAVRLAVPEYRRPVSGTLIFAAVLIGIGLSNLLGWGLIWPLVLIAIGVAILLRGAVGRG